MEISFSWGFPSICATKLRSEWKPSMQIILWKVTELLTKIYSEKHSASMIKTLNCCFHIRQNVVYLMRKFWLSKGFPFFMYLDIITANDSIKSHWTKYLFGEAFMRQWWKPFILFSFSMFVVVYLMRKFRLRWFFPYYLYQIAPY